MEYYAALDIGTSTVKCIIGKQKVDKNLEITAIGEAKSTGVRRGIILNRPNAILDIRKSIDSAEKQAGIQIQKISYGINGLHVSMESDAEKIPLLVFPNIYIQQAAKNNIEYCINNAGLELDHCIPNSIASAFAVMSDMVGSANNLIIDVGAQISNIAHYTNDTLQQINVYPFGGCNQQDKDAMVRFSELIVDEYASVDNFILTGGGSLIPQFNNTFKGAFGNRFRIGLPKVQIPTEYVKEEDLSKYSNIVGILIYSFKKSTILRT